MTQFEIMTSTASGRHSARFACAHESEVGLLPFPNRENALSSKSSKAVTLMKNLSFRSDRASGTSCRDPHHTAGSEFNRDFWQRVLTRHAVAATTPLGADIITTGVTIRIPTIEAATAIAIGITAGGTTAGSTIGFTTNR
jgi:hypothetical protein